jgi:hypothetical protein
LHFSSGIVVLENINTIADPAAAWERLAEDDSYDTSVGNIGGVPAALIDPKKSYGAKGSVTFVSSDGTWLVVLGDGKLSIEDLTRIATSMKAVSQKSQLP